MRENYENLANAIIIQAVKDYREAKTFLKKHPRTDELEADVVARLAERKKRREELKRKNLPPEQEKKSREERLLDAIRSNERMAKETERFFCSEWFSRLANINGHWLLERLRREMEAD